MIYEQNYFGIAYNQNVRDKQLVFVINGKLW